MLGVGGEVELVRPVARRTHLDGRDRRNRRQRARGHETQRRATLPQLHRQWHERCFARLYIDSLETASFDGKDVEVAQGLQVIAAVGSDERKSREDGGEQRGDGSFRGSESEAATAK